MLLKQRRTRLGQNQYPAVGMINGRMTVVLSLGPLPGLTGALFGTHISPSLPSWIRDHQYGEAVQKFIFRAQHNWSWLRRWLGIWVNDQNTVAAMDAQTGKILWSFVEEPADRYGAEGDEPIIERMEARRKNYRLEVLCGPDTWGIPVIAGDGTVYASSGWQGRMYAINDRNDDGKLDPDEVSQHKFSAAFLNGPALAPGLLAATPCWGGMYVWRTEAT